MIYTSYFAMLKKLPEEIIPISICGKAPEWYKGLQCKRLAPKWSFFREWKQSHDNQFYIEHFQSEVLDQLSADEIVRQLRKLSSGRDIALICYEKPGDFCHRHLVAEWLSNNGYPVREWTPGGMESNYTYEMHGEV